jgi:hypothetical protein
MEAHFNILMGWLNELSWLRRSFVWPRVNKTVKRQAEEMALLKNGRPHPLEVRTGRMGFRAII